MPVDRTGTYCGRALTSGIADFWLIQSDDRHRLISSFLVRPVQ
jgi:hypothetical protein